MIANSAFLDVALLNREMYGHTFSHGRALPFHANAERPQAVRIELHARLERRRPHRWGLLRSAAASGALHRRTVSPLLARATSPARGAALALYCLAAKYSLRARTFIPLRLIFTSILCILSSRFAGSKPIAY